MTGKKESRSSLWVETYDKSDTDTPGDAQRVPWVTVLYHPVLSRIGDEADLSAVLRGKTIVISRTEPDLVNPEGSSSWPLADPFLSRKGVELRADSDADALELVPTDPSVQAVLDGVPLDGPRRIDGPELDRGVFFELGGRVILLLHRRLPRGPRLHDLGLVGHSEPIDDMRSRIFRVAKVNVPVLLRGPTGSGKELAARAVHEASDRAEQPFEAVNVAAFAPQMAAAELFGHVKGAFTGAVADNPGYFLRADRGTLFLDEIGEAPIDVQVMLLRALETSTIQPVGGAGAKPVEVRIIAATDADLDRLVEQGKFRSALLHRLKGFEIRIPSLAERREDLGRLMMCFIKAVLAELGDPGRLQEDQPTPRPWMPLHVARAMLLYSWPGNVRELRNTVRQLLIASSDRDQLELDPSLAHLTAARDVAAPPPPPPVASPAAPSRRKPADITEEELLAALTKHRWRLNPTAKFLGISNSSLHMLIDRSPNVRKATELTRDEILKARATAGDDVDVMAEALRVSPRGLQLRLKALGL